VSFKKSRRFIAVTPLLGLDMLTATGMPSGGKALLAGDRAELFNQQAIMTRFAGFASRLGHKRLRVGIRAQPPPRTLHRFSIALRCCALTPSSTSVRRQTAGTVIGVIN
jgi:hypothetical protein